MGDHARRHHGWKQWQWNDSGMAVEWQWNGSGSETRVHRVRDACQAVFFSGCPSHVVTHALPLELRGG